MRQVGYSLVRLADTIEVRFWSVLVPSRIFGDDLGLDVHAPHVGDTFADGAYQLLEKWEDGDPPNQFYVRNGETLAITDGKLVATNRYAPIEITERQNAMSAAVMSKRDDVIGGGVTFNGALYQTRRDDRENIAGAAQLAALWLGSGGDASSLRWADPDSDFLWIAADNSLVPMTAPDAIGLGRAAAAKKQAAIFVAYGLKTAIDTAADQAELDAIDITAGWPA